MNKTLEEIGKELFKRWFVDFEFPNEQGKPYKSNGGKMVDRNGRDTERMASWILRRWDGNFRFKKNPLSSREREKRKGAYPYYGATEIMDYIDDYILMVFIS